MTAGKEAGIRLSLVPLVLPGHCTSGTCIAKVEESEGDVMREVSCHAVCPLLPEGQIR